MIRPDIAVGRFDGHLDAHVLTVLKSEVAAARSQGNFSKIPPRDAATTTVEIEGARASLGGADEATGAWSQLLEHLNALQFDLLHFPTAAIALELTDGGKGANLVYQGKEPLRVDLSDIHVRAVLWEGFTKRGDWHSTQNPSIVQGNEVAQAGWSMRLPFEHNFKVGQGQVVKAYVTLALYDGETRVPVSIVAG